MPFRTKFLSAIALCTTVALSHPALAQEEPDLDTVVATVNDTKITLGHVIAMRSGLPAQYAQLPPDYLFSGILDQLIQQTLLMQAMEGQPSRKSELLIENENRAIIASEIIQSVMGADLTEEEVTAAFNDKYTSQDAQTEYKAAHILVETEDEAKALVAQLNDGADFATLAKEHSTGPSGPNGGDLGWFSEGLLVEPFYNAAIALQPGQVSAPVQTEFGWHVIRLDDTREKEKPALDEVRAQLEDEMREAAFNAYVEKLENAATVDRAGAEAIDPAAINNFDLLEN